VLADAAPPPAALPAWLIAGLILVVVVAALVGVVWLVRRSKRQ
jgi:hypothetical protein